MAHQDPKVKQVPKEPQAFLGQRETQEMVGQWDPKARQGKQDPRVRPVRRVTRVQAAKRVPRVLEVRQDRPDPKAIWDHLAHGEKWALEVPRASRVSPADRPNGNSSPIGPTRH